jgi:mono/diheme cytochrome c family protein
MRLVVDMKTLLILISIMGLHAEDFISEFEYGQMLYQNTRGVSCVPCHGERGEGREIVSYRVKNGSVVSIMGPDIRNSTLKQIKKSLEEGRGVMPKYFFTDKEVKTIHAYLVEVNSKKEDSK